MFGDVVAALRDREVPVDRAVVLELIDVCDLAAVALNEALDGFDKAGLWELDHAPSLVAWLKVQGRRTTSEASRLHRRMLRMRCLTHVRDGWGDLRLSNGHVDVIVNHVTDRTVGLFQDGEAERVLVLSRLSVDDANTVMLRWAAEAREFLTADPTNPKPNDRDGAGGDDEAGDAGSGDSGVEAGMEPSSLFASRTLDGRMAVKGDLDVDVAEAVASALALADSGDLDEVPAARRAAALGRVCRFFLNNHANADLPKARPGRRRARAQIHVILGPDGRGENEAGVPLPPSMVERLKCDALVNDVRFADGQILYYGHTKRSAPDVLFNALVVRDRGCRFKGCRRPAYWCDAHHVVPWDPRGGNGPTSIENMVLLCDHHHNKIHRRGWSMKLLPDATLVITDPSGQVLRSKPPGDPEQRTRLPI